MKTFYLDNNEEEHFDFDVFAITCKQSVYRVISEINEQLALSLAFTELLDFRHEKGEDFLFPIYQYELEKLNIEFNLLPNETSLQPQVSSIKSETTFDLFAGDIEQSIKLLPELVSADFLLLIKGENRYLYNHSVLEALKEITLFTEVKEIFMDDLADKKSRSHLLF